MLRSSQNIAKKVAKRGDCTSYLELHLRSIIIRVLAQLGYKRIKYPQLSCKETVLKFIAISLKANNPNKDAAYRAKYAKKLEEFLLHCQYPQEIQAQHQLKSTPPANYQQTPSSPRESGTPGTRRTSSNSPNSSISFAPNWSRPTSRSTSTSSSGETQEPFAFSFTRTKLNK